MKPDAKLIAAFDDLISEPALMALTGYSKSGLAKMRAAGKIKNWSTINGRRIMYSKTEIAQLLNLQVNQ